MNSHDYQVTFCSTMADTYESEGNHYMAEHYRLRADMHRGFSEAIEHAEEVLRVQRQHRKSLFCGSQL